MSNKKPVKANKNPLDEATPFKAAASINLHQTTWSAPFPPPEALQAFENIAPGTGAQIMHMALEQQKHRMDLEKHSVKESYDKARRGQYYALIIAILGISASVILSLQNHDVVAGIIGGSTIIGLVGAFLSGKVQIRKSLESKAPTSTN